MKCSYDLRGSIEMGICSECGQSFDPDDPDTFNRFANQRKPFEKRFGCAGNVVLIHSAVVGLIGLWILITPPWYYFEPHQGAMLLYIIDFPAVALLRFLIPLFGDSALGYVIFALFGGTMQYYLLARIMLWLCAPVTKTSSEKGH